MEAITIREIRNQLQMTQKHMAKELDISFCTINRWENGRTKPSRLAQKALIDLCIKNKLNSRIIEQLVSGTNC